MAGFFLLDPPGSALLTFVSGPVDPLVQHNVMIFGGVLDAHLQLVGVLEDPSMGAPMLSSSPCVFRATGGHD